MRLVPAAGRLAGRLEQEVRARPWAHEAFYALIRRSPVLRSLAGRARARARSEAPVDAPSLPDLPPALLELRRAAVAARLGRTP